MQGIFIGVIAAYMVLGPEYVRLSLSSAYITDDSTFQRNYGSHLKIMKGLLKRVLAVMMRSWRKRGMILKKCLAHCLEGKGGCEL